MSCAAPLRSGRLNQWIRVLVLAVLGVAYSSSTRAEVGDPSTSFETPRGYFSEQIGLGRWIYPQSAEDEIKELQVIQSTAWKQITAELGGEISSNMEIRIAINPDEMRKLAPGNRRLPAYATGVAFPRAGLILLTLTAPKTWRPVAAEMVLVHELSHLALHRAVGGKSLPRWFSEGVAIRQADERSFARLRALWEGTVQDRLIPLEQLSDSFPARHYRVNLAYAQSADFVAYLLDGADNQRRFRELIGNLREGMEFSQAMLDAYNVSPGYLEREWRRLLQQRFSRLPLLLTGLGTVWILASILLFVAYVRMKQKQKATLLRWKQEEETKKRKTTAARSTGDVSEEASVSPSPEEEQSRVRDKGGVPTIEYKGENHTVH